MSSSFAIRPFPGIAKRAETDEPALAGSPMEIINAGFDALIAQVESGNYVPHGTPVEKPKPARRKPAAPRASGSPPAKRKKRPVSSDDDID
ncbi:MAG: hypothetical protein L6Q98_19935 [Anaerolineae bacterium]|nr:hypothetical protein [Anaerolineae bacterium]NUQ05739.1 hypothetical protein [Anaerolineae bacterium]